MAPRPKGAPKLGGKKNIRLTANQEVFTQDVHRAMGQIDVGTASWNGAIRECIQSCMDGKMTPAVVLALKTRKASKSNG